MRKEGDRERERFQHYSELRVASALLSCFGPSATMKNGIDHSICHITPNVLSLALE
jgi:hypothetical protein